MARALWPLALLIALVGSTRFPSSAFADFTTAQVVGQVAVIGAGIALAGFALGGREGLAATVLLTAIAVYCAWWLSLGIDQNISPYTWSGAAGGLNRWSRYLTEAAINLWPLIAAACVAAVLLGRRLGVAAWHAIALLALTLLVLATPSRAFWSDGCNSHGGAAPAILAPIVPQLMDHGIGVMPDYSSTQAGCIQTFRRPGEAGPRGRPIAEGPWKPFWRGGDGLSDRGS